MDCKLKPTFHHTHQQFYTQIFISYLDQYHFTFIEDNFLDLLFMLSHITASLTRPPGSSPSALLWSIRNLSNHLRMVAFPGTEPGQYSASHFLVTAAFFFSPKNSVALKHEILFYAFFWGENAIFHEPMSNRYELFSPVFKVRTNYKTIGFSSNFPFMKWIRTFVCMFL